MATKPFNQMPFANFWDVEFMAVRFVSSLVKTKNPKSVERRLTDRKRLKKLSAIKSCEPSLDGGGGVSGMISVPLFLDERLRWALNKS